MKCLNNALVGSLLTLSSMTANMAHARDIQPYDVVPAPAGTQSLITYINYSNANTAYSDGKEVGGELKSFSVSERYTYFLDLDGHPALITAVVPVHVDLENGRIGENNLGSAEGIGDTTLAFTYWLHSDEITGRYLDATAYLDLPTGEYDEDDSLNIGSNRVSYALQLNGHYRILPKLSIEGSVDVSLYEDNTKANTQHATSEQDPTYAAQMYVNYATSPTVSLSAGWGGFWGGEQKLDGVKTGSNSDLQQARAVASWWVTPKFQLLGQVNHDVEVNGGFQADTSYLLRIVKLF